jgi:hypothetical protein
MKRVKKLCKDRKNPSTIPQGLKRKIPVKRSRGRPKGCKDTKPRVKKRNLESINDSNTPLLHTLLTGDNSIIVSNPERVCASLSNCTSQASALSNYPKEKHEFLRHFTPEDLADGNLAAVNCEKYDDWKEAEFVEEGVEEFQGQLFGSGEPLNTPIDQFANGCDTTVLYSLYSQQQIDPDCWMYPLPCE